MKAKELMLKDWICSPDGECGQVCELSQGSVKICVPQSKNGDVLRIDGDPEYFKGIPLTKEIIHLNAVDFTLKYDIRYNPIPFWYEEGRFYCGFFGSYEIEVNYVHEVQNFLRAIGFAEEADTFKIK